MRRREGISLFIVTGRTGHSLVAAKALPFAVLEKVNNIYLFSESKGFDIPKCRYITIPGWIKNARPSVIGKILRIFFEPAQLLYYSYKLRPDFINGVYCLPKGLNSYIVSRIAGIKCVNSIIGSVLEIETELPFRVFWRNLNLWHLRGCECITIKGRTDRDYLVSRGLDPSKMFNFNGAIDTARFSFSVESRTTDILFMGSFIDLKGPFRIIRIIKLLQPLFPGLKVIMAGEGALLKQTRQLADDLEVTKNIVFEGFKKETVPYFQKAKILLMPSRSDSMPTSMLEAMSCGCVPVISDVGNVAQAALDNFNSRVIGDYNDLEGFAEAVADLLRDEPKRAEFARNARRMIEDKYCIENQSLEAERIIKYLENN